MITFDEQMKKVQEFTTRADFDPSIRLQFAPMIGTLKRAYDAEILAYEKRLHELEEQLKKAKPDPDPEQPKPKRTRRKKTAE